jgi:hypothetical protein
LRQHHAAPTQGLFVDVGPDRQFVFLGWSTYTHDASDFPNQQHWFTAEGNCNGSKAELILYESFGERFDHPQAVTTTPVGKVTSTSSIAADFAERIGEPCGLGRLESRDQLLAAVPGQCLSHLQLNTCP